MLECWYDGWSGLHHSNVSGEMRGGGGGGGIMPLCTSSVSNTVQSQVNHFLPGGGGGGGGLVLTYQHITTTHRTLQLFSSAPTLYLQPITPPHSQEN